MEDTGWLSPGTVENDATVGTVGWTDAVFARISDDLEAFAVSSGAVTYYLKAVAFSVPMLGGTIVGVEVRVEGIISYPGGPSWTPEVRLVLADGSIGAVDRGVLTSPIWETTPSTYVNFGGATDTWEEVLGWADVTNANFGFVISLATPPPSDTIYIDHLQMKIYYVELQPLWQEDPLGSLIRGQPGRKLGV